MPKPIKDDTGSMGFQVRPANRVDSLGFLLPGKNDHNPEKRFVPKAVGESGDRGNNINFTEEEVGAMARAIPKLFEKWELSDSEACTLLGGIKEERWNHWKKDAATAGIDNQDLKMRIAHLIGIHAGLLTIFSEPETGYAWIKGADKNFGGKSALDVMLDGEIASIRKWIDAEIRF